ncbi:MAG: CxxxxCH/CxxCH domain c-type cytochrome [Desulfuromonadaceae bacterium]
MGKVIKKKIQGMNWLMKSGIVLLLTLATTVFMYEGWYKPKPADAAITSVVAAAAATAGTNAAPTVSFAIPTNASGKRMLVAGVSFATSTAVVPTVTCTYGGTALTAVTGTNTSATSSTGHTVLFYMLDNPTLMNNTARALTYTVSVGTLTATSLHYAVYDGAAQNAPSGGSYNGGTTSNSTTAISPALAIATGDIGFSIIQTIRGGVATFITVTPATNWALPAGVTAQQGGAATPGGASRYLFTSTTAGAADTAAHATARAGFNSVSGMVIKMGDTTPPVAGTVNISPDYTNGATSYTGASATITAQFTESDAGSTVTGCEYTTNGTAWTATGAVVSGSGPTYTCTATPTGLTGVLTINMRATSSGGVGTATALTRTVDATAPSNSTLTILPGNASNNIFWSAATDTGGGAIGSYVLVYAASSTAPLDCASGTAVPGSPFSSSIFSAVHSGLANGSAYSYRICAQDTLNNKSVGVVRTATPVNDLTKVSSCAGCHFNTGIADAASPRGSLFQGSHGKHAGSAAGQYAKACSTCHISNTAYNHANGNINMENVTYSKTASFAVNDGTFSGGTCDATYCHSNGTSVISGTVPANTSGVWGTAGNCGGCHGTAADDGRPNYANGTPKRNTHGDGVSYGKTHKVKECSVCHDGIGGSKGAFTIISTSHHNDGTYNIRTTLGYNQTAGTCATAGCHGSVAWGGSLGCIDCHNIAQGTRSAITTEFGLAWGHKKQGRGTIVNGTNVTNADCIVCHLEGKFSTQAINTTYHLGVPGGNIDLRDPDALGTDVNLGETPITNISNTAFTFTKFATSYAAGSRTTTGHLSNTDIANVITQKFCLKCHDANGATNTTARSGAGATQYLPFGAASVNGAAYTVGLSAGVIGGVVDVDSMFATTNSTFHPVKGPQNNSYASSTTPRMVAPYGVAKTAGTPSIGVVMNCFDCHNAPTTPLLTRTVAAHGSTAPNAFRGAVYETTNTLCHVCHTGYTVTTGNHGAGSAINSSTNSGMGTYMAGQCQRCHASTNTAVRPVRGEDAHGFNRFAGTGTDAMWPIGATETYRPFAFFRNTTQWTTTSWKPLSGTGVPTGTATCGGTMSATNCGDNMIAYTPGGAF